MMNKIRFIEVHTREAIADVAALAGCIWPEHYTPIIGKAQVGYMLAKFQLPEAIRRQIAEEGCRYFLIRDGAGALIGYLGFAVKGEELFLSKIYLARENRGQGNGRKAMDFLEALARKENCSRIALTVNKQNLRSIAAYEKMGFVKAGPLVQDIGGGFVMNDYRMEKPL